MPTESAELIDGEEIPFQSEPDRDVVGRILFAITASWVALAAVPGALPLGSPDDAQRVVFIGVAIATIVALVGLTVAWVRVDALGREAGRVGIWASRLAIALAAVDVTMVLLVPEGSPYRGAILGVALLGILLAAFVSVIGTPRAPVAITGARISNLPLVGSLAALILIGAYYVAVNSMFGAVKNTTDPEWIRYSDLLSGLESLAFAAAGALLGTTIQRQVTAGVEKELTSADIANEELDALATEIATAADRGEVVEVQSVESMRVLMRESLLEDPTVYLNAPGLVEQRVAERIAVAKPTADLGRRIRERQARARAVRRT